MQKLLNGRELAAYIKNRQARQVRSLRQALRVEPRLAIVVTVDNPAIDVYVRLKKRYGDDIGVSVDIHRVSQAEVPALVGKLNDDRTVHGIIIQLPLADPLATEELVNLVAPAKDVDALGAQAAFDPATPMAIMWLLSGYNIELKGKRIVLVGHGKLVGKPLAKLLAESGLSVEVVDEHTKNLTQAVIQAEVLITATGQPGLITSHMISAGTVVVDAGVAGEQGKTAGDLDPAVYQRDDLTLTPAKGGVGPLTVCALFENVLRAARD